MHEFEQLEDAVIAALEPLKAQGLRTLEPYSGQLEADEIEQVTLRFPCIYVIAAGLKNAIENKLDKCRMTLTLVVGDRNVRSLSSAARGDTTSPGVYALLEAARAALHRVHIINGWTPLSIVGEDPLVYLPQSNLCVYTAVYEMRGLRNL